MTKALVTFRSVPSLYCGHRQKGCRPYRPALLRIVRQLGQLSHKRSCTHDPHGPNVLAASASVCCIAVQAPPNCRLPMLLQQVSSVYTITEVCSSNIIHRIIAYKVQALTVFVNFQDQLRAGMFNLFVIGRSIRLSSSYLFVEVIAHSMKPIFLCNRIGYGK